ncbi:MAG: hypothetical protein IJ597_00085 [Synergistaceae bacterium]|nr:hypothetical protein [Synergistaceae bacterium]
MLKAKVIEYNGYQGILIPEEIHTDYTEFFIKKEDEVYTLCPTDKEWLAIRGLDYEELENLWE